ncbi:hypothetical protein A3841_04935 [Pontibacter flavimaris]|uniref:Uncharacterized protein n=1 Tax=Pontibacter flavimaris TaxID=1797110 RepID=A0A1Q5P9J6_9BACT|nr:hypothetical protein A3841_04935 [Pontibacter flavimaris]
MQAGTINLSYRVCWSIKRTKSINQYKGRCLKEKKVSSEVYFRYANNTAGPKMFQVYFGGFAK